MFILGITGKAGAGKDTVGKYIADKLGWERAAFAEPLKMMLAAIDIVEPPRELKEEIMPAWGFSYRRAAQLLGTEWGRALSPAGDIWVNIMHQRIVNAQSVGMPGFVITDVRFDNEVALIARLGGTLLHIEGRNYEVTEHKSEQGIPFTLGDYKIFNDGSLEQLYSAVDMVLYEMGVAQ